MSARIRCATSTSPLSACVTAATNRFCFDENRKYRPGREMAAARATLRLTLEMAFARAGTPGTVVVEQRFPEPTADADAIERLLLARLERTPPPAAVERLELELAGVEPAVGQQLPLFVPQAARTAKLGWQLTRLALTFGEDRVRKAIVTDPDAPLAEWRWTWR